MDCEGTGQAWTIVEGNDVTFTVDKRQKNCSKNPLASPRKMESIDARKESQGPDKWSGWCKDVRFSIVTGGTGACRWVCHGT